MRFWVFGLCTHGAILTPNVEHFWQNIVLTIYALIALQLIQVFSCFSSILLLIDLLQKSFCNFFSALNKLYEIDYKQSRCYELKDLKHWKTPWKTLLGPQILSLILTMIGKTVSGKVFAPVIDVQIKCIPIPCHQFVRTLLDRQWASRGS